jgi:Family of unknown function (DUF5706)
LEAPELIRARSLHKDVREELVRADAKATTLLSVVSILLGALLGGAIAGDWTPADLKCVLTVLFWIAVGLGMGAEGHLLAAVLPRVKHPKDATQVRYFGHVVQLEDDEELKRRLTDADGELEQLTDQVYVLSGIVDSKYQHVRTALQWLAAAVVLGFASVALNAIL